MGRFATDFSVIFQVENHSCFAGSLLASRKMTCRDVNHKQMFQAEYLPKRLKKGFTWDEHVLLNCNLGIHIGFGFNLQKHPPKQEEPSESQV